MANIWQDKPSTNEPEFDVVASVLEAMHGLYAAEVADFFSALHSHSGDKSCSLAWANVAVRLRQREHQRMLS